MDKYKIDSHKLIYHPRRVSDWSEGKNIYPIYAEISPSNTCNHRCSFCAYDFLGYERKFIDAKLLKKTLTEMGELGIKSVLYSGEGEPLLHKDIADIINHTKKVAGIDVALATNGVLLSKKIADSIVENLSWLRISINAGTSKTYSKVHNTNINDFDKVIDNLSCAVKVRQQKKSECTIGMQLLLLPDNLEEASILAQIAKEIGVDYLVVKPYSQYLFSKTTKYANIKYEDYLHLADKLKKFNDDNFSVVFRINTMKKWDDGKKNYKHCLALPFWAHIDTDGNVWGCGAFVSDERFNVGNINKSSFKEIWNSEKRKNLTKWASEQLNTSKCRVNCRMDEVNRYLWELIHSPEHVNFI